MENGEKEQELKADEYALEGKALRSRMQDRTIDSHGRFVVPYLSKGMRVLDAGCGGGSITAGIAEMVAPGEVVGIETSSEQIAEAERLAQSKGLKSLRFVHGSVYELPLEDSSFDMVFSHAVLDHLSDPARALQEFFRVLKSGGLVAVRVPDARGDLFSPEDSRLAQTFRWATQVMKHNGGNREIGCRIPRLLMAAGFVAPVFSAEIDCNGTSDSRRRVAEMMASTLAESTLARQVVELGFADSRTLSELGEAWLQWAEDPYGFCAVTWIQAIAHRP
jgi:ubiquinone/menaquinone biosynthesis C-methylase UbiE